MSTIIKPPRKELAFSVGGLKDRKKWRALIKREEKRLIDEIIRRYKK